MQFHAIIKKGSGKATVYRERDMVNYIASLGRDDKDVEITYDIYKRKRKRSNDQNAYYWLLLEMIRERMTELGHETGKDELHQFFKGRFLYTEFLDEKTGEIMRLPRKSSEVSTDEFNAFIEDVKRFSATVLDLVLPDPEQ